MTDISAIGPKELIDILTSDLFSLLASDELSLLTLPLWLLSLACFILQYSTHVSVIVYAWALVTLLQIDTIICILVDRVSAMSTYRSYIQLAQSCSTLHSHIQ